MAQRRMIFALGLLTLATSCGKKSSSADPAPATTSTDPSTTNTTTTGVGTVTIDLVPTIVLASVTGGSGGAALDDAPEAKLDSNDPKAATEALDQVFENAKDIKGCLAGFGRQDPPTPNADCYGPSVVTKNHPDWTASMPADQQNPHLPSGDLGVFDATAAATGEACISAKMNQLTGGVRKRVSQAIETGKRMLCVARVLGKQLPTDVGGKIDLADDVNAALAAAAADNPQAKNLTFKTVQITLVKDKVYQTEVEATVPSATVWTRVVAEETDATHSTGYVWGVVNGTAPGQPVTVDAFSVLFKKDGDTLSYNATKSQAQSDADKAALEADKTALFESDKRVRVATTGNPGYDQVLAKVDTATGVGEMVYMWTAGGAQEEQRTMHAKTTLESDGTKDGWGYFGFGAKLSDFRTLVKGGSVPATTASIEKMICNWAGPGNNHTGVAYAQKQLFKLDTAAGVYKPTESHVGFAAQNSCGQTGYTTSFTVAKGNNAADVQASDYAAWPTFDLTALDDTTKADLSSVSSLLLTSDL